MENVVTLRDEQVYEQVQINPELVERSITQGERAGEMFKYHRATYAGSKSGFTVSPEVAQLWAEGEIATLTLRQNTYEKAVTLVDEESGEETTTTVEVTNFIYAGHMTNAQVLKRAQFASDKALVAKRAELQLAKEFQAIPADMEA